MLAKANGPLWALGAVLAVCFSYWSASSGWAFARFLLALFAAAYVPGSLLLGRARAELDALEHLLLSLCLGLAAACAVYWLIGWFGWFGLLDIVAAPWLIIWLRTRARSFANPPLIALGPAAAAVVPLAFLPLFFRNLDLNAGGELSLYPLPDALFHLSIAHELTHQVPPEAPFLPGRPLGYHYGMDLAAALLCRLGRIEPADVVLRFLPTLFLLLLAGGAFALARRLTGSRALAAAVAVLVPFGEDFSWIPGLLRGGTDVWAIGYFGMPTVVSLYLLNPMLPALAFLFAGLLATLLYLEAPSRARLGLAALLLASIFELKLFTAAHLLGALSLAGALSALRAGDRRLLRLALATAALAAPMTLATWLGSAGRAAVALHPWPYVPGALVRMGLMSAALSAHLEELLLRGRVTAMGLLSYAGFALPLYLLLSAGARVLALPRLLAAVREASRDPFRLALALLVLTGPILSLSLSVTPRGYDERAQYNDAVWFYLDAKHVAWLFVAEALRGLMERRSRRIGALALALVLALSVPSSLQFFAFQAAQRDTQRLPRELLLALRELRARAAPGDVVLASERLTAAVLALNPQRTPELRVFPVYFASPDELADEARALSRFWTAWDAGGLAADFVSAKKARFALVEAGRGAPPAATPLYENSGFRLLSLDAAR